ncbi:hypothetical protein [Paenibacillus prosopidis]|uniref:DUF4372 domain-containing protein n=1 Tax=Paenibacillus prosopidis TaxID=630520 RepID=A0A368W7Q2_9BACL|nr:hypothetical protein [Paenibacillus prosopidis]RCW50879.1 hypothetical protein DFP97_10271 [Paenibacillus prosopidis]
MDKNTIKSTLTEYLIPLNPKLMLEQIEQLDLDKYVKKLDSVTTAKLFVFAQLMQIQSYTDISLNVKQNGKLQETINLTTISTSQLSRKWREMDPAFLESVFRDFVQKLFQRLGMSKAAGKRFLRFRVS